MQEPSALGQDFPLRELRVVQNLVKLEQQLRAILMRQVQHRGRDRAPNAACLARRLRPVWILRGDASVVLQDVPAHRVIATIILQLRVAHKSIEDVWVQVELHTDLADRLEGLHLLPLHGVLQNLQKLQHPIAGLGQVADHLVAPLGDRLGSFLPESFVLVHNKVDHVRLRKQRDLTARDVLLLVDAELLQELKDGEHQVPVEKRRHP
mmetsp:Transcript_59751/g.166818  ORF Transcript_59751/g.166818 Transcript_59751/m.166818 type:complete len:208 (+) Transcript_59751:828-1451(+)